ncbi:hypothetical protein EKH55_0516 [Sinorhizobium alkalisoli]|nr:hypothetical protein EKH55_0516 [Sinorhizobium alkalisoli]
MTKGIVRHDGYRDVEREPDRNGFHPALEKPARKSRALSYCMNLQSGTDLKIKSQRRHASASERRRRQVCAP